MSVAFTTSAHYAMPTLAALQRPIIGEAGFDGRTRGGLVLPPGTRMDFAPNVALPAGMVARLRVVVLSVALPSGQDVEAAVRVGSSPGGSEASLSWWGYPGGTRRQRRLHAATITASFSSPVAQAHVFVDTRLRVFSARGVFTAARS